MVLVCSVWLGGMPYSDSDSRDSIDIDQKKPNAITYIDLIGSVYVTYIT